MRPIDAIAHLSRLRAVSGHSFWTDTIEGLVGGELDATRVLGHQQVTDIHLVVIAIANNGSVATFDKGLISLVGKKQVSHVTLIPA